MRRRLALLAAVVVVVAVPVVGWRAGVWNSPSAAERAGQAQSGAGTRTGLTLYPAGSRIDVPDIRGEALDGDQLAVVDLRGQIVVLNVWGSWCNPCRAETPDLVRLAGETSARGVRFVGIDTRDNPDAARAFVRTFKVPYPSIIDRDGRVLLEFNGVIPVSALPSTVVIDPAGKIAARVIGKVSYATLRGIVDDLLAQTAATTPINPRQGGT